MKRMLFAVIFGMVLMINAFAADGDLIVNGKVGIGTTSPSAPLEVAGSAYIFPANGNLGLDVKIVHDQNPSLWLHSRNANKGFMIVYANDDQTYFCKSTGTSSCVASFASGGSAYALIAYGNMYATGQYLSSDVRWKKNVAPINNAVSLIQGLQGVRFDWRTDEFKDKNFDRDTQLGLVAQDAERVLPEIVKTDEKGYKAVSYAKLTAVLVEAVKEQQKEIERLKARLKAVEGKQ